MKKIVLGAVIVSLTLHGCNDTAGTPTASTNSEQLTLKWSCNGSPGPFGMTFTFKTQSDASQPFKTGSVNFEQQNPFGGEMTSWFVEFKENFVIEDMVFWKGKDGQNTLTWVSSESGDPIECSLSPGPLSEAKTKAPQEDTRELIEKFWSENERCRGGSGDNPSTMQACERRDEISRMLSSEGWCLGRPDQWVGDAAWVSVVRTFGTTRGVN